MIPFCPTCLPPSGCLTKPPGKCVLYSGVYLPFIGVTAGENLDDILGTLNSILQAGSGGLSSVTTSDSSSISFSGDGTIGNPLSADFTGTIPPDTNIYNTSGTITAQRLVTGEYGSSLTFSWKDQFGVPDKYILGVNSGGGGGRVRVLGPTGSLIINEQDLRIGSAGTSTTQAYLQINMTDFNFVFGADPTILNIKNDGLYLPTTPNLSSLATDGTGKIIAGTSTTPTLQQVTTAGNTANNLVALTGVNNALNVSGLHLGTNGVTGIILSGNPIAGTFNNLAINAGNVSMNLGTTNFQVNAQTPANFVSVDTTTPTNFNTRVNGLDAVNSNEFVTLNQLQTTLPISGSPDYIQNRTTQQTANFNISGSGIINTTLGIGTGAAPLSKLEVRSPSSSVDTLRLAYDGANYMSTIVDLNANTTFSLTSGSNAVFTYAQPIVASAGIYTRIGNREGSNFFTWAGGNGTQTTDPGLKFTASASPVAVKAAFNGTQSTVPILDYSFGSVVIGSGAWTTAASSGPHPIGANLVVKAPTITKGTVDVTLAASVYIDAAPTTGLSNYSLYVASGLSYFGGQIKITGGTPGINKVLTDVDGTGLAVWTTLAAGGSVTQVALTAPSVFSVGGSPVTTTGTLAITFATGQTANQVLASPNGSTGAVSLRALVAADIPSLDAAKITTGTFGTAFLGSGTANSTVFLRGDGTWSNTLAGAFNTTGRITPTLITEQVRVAYDASNYMNFVVASNGSTTIDLTGTTPLFSFGKGTSFTAGLAANNTGFNLSVVSINGGTSTTSATYLFGGAATVNYRVGVRGSGANTLAAASSGTNFIVANNAITTASSGTHAVVANATIMAGTITSGGASTVTDGTSLLIDGPTTGGTNSYSLLIRAGDAKVAGNSITGGQRVGYTAWSTATLTATTSMYFLEYTGSISSTLTFPAVATNIGQMYFFENNGTGTVTVSPGVWNQTGGGTTLTSYGPASSFYVISNGTNWVRIV